MRILINVRDLMQAGGVCNLYRMLKPHFDEKNVAYFVNSYSPNSSNHLGGFSIGKLFFFIIDLFRFFCRLCFYRCDVVLLNPAFGFTAIWRDGVYALIARKIFHKKVWFLWNGSHFQTIEKMSPRALRLFKRLYFNSEGMFVLSSMISDNFIKMGYGHSIYLITTAAEDRLLTVPCCYESKPVYNILYLARVEKSKGIFLALESVKIAQEKTSVPFSFTVAGDGTALAEAKEYVKKHNVSNVEFLGYVRNEKKYQSFSRADVYLFTSYGEGMPCSILEAMAAGLPLVTSAVGGIPDLFQQGQMGAMLNTFDPKDYAEQLVAMLENPSLFEKYGRYNREYAKQHLLASCIAQKITNIIEQKDASSVS